MTADCSSLRVALGAPADSGVVGVMDSVRWSRRDCPPLAARRLAYSDPVIDTPGSHPAAPAPGTPALGRALAAAPGHFEELRGPVNRENLFPLLVDPSDWRLIEVGVLQRVRLLESVISDVYSAQQLLARGLLPRALVQGHPGYLRAMHGAMANGSTCLHVTAFDLARGTGGDWRVVGQHCQTPAGLGYLLENRNAIASQFPQAFNSMRMQRIDDTYRALMDGLRDQCAAGADSHLALLTPGPYSETYFEHAYLARNLGLTLVEGGDLTVREERLYLKTLRGLVPIHGLLRSVDDAYLDPLELRPDSTLGVAGLLQAIRAGNVLVANAPGVAFLESPALLGFLPALCEHLLGEELRLSSLPTWWCGEPSAMQRAIGQLSSLVIKPTYPYSLTRESFEPTLGQSLSASELEAWRERIVERPQEHTLQTYPPLSQIPPWQSPTPDPSTQNGGVGVLPRSVMLRVFALCDAAGSWRVLPGGLARVRDSHGKIVPMQYGGSSADVWALTRKSVNPGGAPVQPRPTPTTQAGSERIVTSRAAESLYWLGRYTERTGNLTHLARLTLECLHGEEQGSLHLLAWLSKLALENTLVLPTVVAATQDCAAFERALITDLAGTAGATSVGYYLRALRFAGSAVRERLSEEHWRMIVRAEEDLSARCAAMAAADHSSLQALHTLRAASDQIAAIRGAQSDYTTGDDGWRLLHAGRLIERLGFLTSSMLGGFATGSVHTNRGFDAMIELFDCTVSLHSLHQHSRDLPTLIDLLVLDHDSARSLAWVVQTLRRELTGLGARGLPDLATLAQQMPDPTHWSLAGMCERQPLPGDATSGDTQPQVAARASYFHKLNDTLLRCSAAVAQVSSQINATCFTHGLQTNQSVGTG